MGDVRAVAGKEWRELLRMSGTRKGAITRHVFSVAVISVLWPWQFGITFLTTNLGVTLAALTAGIYIAGAAPDAFAGERERHTLETMLASRLSDRAILLGKILALLEYGCVAALIMLIFGLITVNLVHGDGRFLMYSGDALLRMLVFTPLAAGLMASMGIHVSLRAKTVKQAQQTFSTATLVVMFIPIVTISVIGVEEMDGFITAIKAADKTVFVVGMAAVMLIVQGVLFGLAMLRFKRSKLIL